jgi:hypothetical protein
MTDCKVNNVNIVTHTCAIFCVIVVAKHVQVIKFTNCNLADIWHQVVWNTIWVFSQKPTFMCTDWIEISKQCCIETWVCLLIINQNMLIKQFCSAIWVCCFKWKCFIKWHNF